MNPILENEKPSANGQEAQPKQTNEQEEDDIDCPDTQVWLWRQDEYQVLDTDYLNQLFPFKINKKTVTPGAQFVFHFLSSSLYYWIELVENEQPVQGKLSKKDTKFIQQVFKEDQGENHVAFRRWGQYFNRSEQFHAHAEKESEFVVPKGELVHEYKRGETEFEIVRYHGDQKDFTPYKERFEVLFLFYIDGVSYVQEEIEPWVYYIIYQKTETSSRQFVGVLSAYIFRITSQRERSRISQVFVMPPYQKQGHGKEILDVFYDISLKRQQCFEITTEIPSFEFQCLRDYKELELLLKEGLFKIEDMVAVKNLKEIESNRSSLLTKGNIKVIKEKFKLPGHQIERLTNLLIYARILQQKEDMPLAFFEENIRQKVISNRSPFKTRKKMPHITLYGETPDMKDFLIEKEKQDLLRNQEEVEEIVTETLNGFRRVITKLQKTKLLTES